MLKIVFEVAVHTEDLNKSGKIQSTYVQNNQETNRILRGLCHKISENQGICELTKFGRKALIKESCAGKSENYVILYIDLKNEENRSNDALKHQRRTSKHQLKVEGNEAIMH